MRDVLLKQSSNLYEVLLFGALYHYSDALIGLISKQLKAMMVVSQLVEEAIVYQICCDVMFLMYFPCYTLLSTNSYEPN